jgi:hypothetical protein
VGQPSAEHQEGSERAGEGLLSSMPDERCDRRENEGQAKQNCFAEVAHSQHHPGRKNVASRARCLPMRSNNALAR